MPDYARPGSLEEATRLLGEGGWVMLAGGTDFYPALGEDSVSQPVLDLSRVAGLRAIERTASGWYIGAMSTWTDIVRADLPNSFKALQQAAREVGSVQIQNRATIAGNICNASPAADGVPPLLVLEAEVELASRAGTRRLPLRNFIHGNRKTARKNDEIVTGLIIPEVACSGNAAFFKLGSRRYLVISIAMVAARIAVNSGGVVSDAAIAVGACSAVAQRLPQLEAALVGCPLTSVSEVVRSDHLDVLSPIGDVRAPASYRMDAALEGVRRALAAAAEGARP